jgi:hypothetical protein
MVNKKRNSTVKILDIISGVFLLFVSFAGAFVGSYLALFSGLIFGILVLMGKQYGRLLGVFTLFIIEALKIYKTITSPYLDASYELITSIPSFIIIILLIIGIIKSKDKNE